MVLINHKNIDILNWHTRIEDYIPFYVSFIQISPITAVPPTFLLIHNPKVNHVAKNNQFLSLPSADQYFWFDKKKLRKDLELKKKKKNRKKTFSHRFDSPEIQIFGKKIKFYIVFLYIR